MDRDKRHPDPSGLDTAVWSLDPTLVHLNHGSYGAVPLAVRAARHAWEERLEGDPTGFYADEYFPALDSSRSKLAQFLGANVDDLAFMTNATSGVNVALGYVARTLMPGDEILVTDHTYNACRQAAEAVALRAGATVVVARVPFGGGGPDEVFEAVVGAVTERTRVAILDHVTSPTALVLPIERLVEVLEPDITVIVDAAHAPGMIPMRVGDSPASFITGNLHKWVMAPKGSAFLRIRHDLLEHVDPLVIGHGWNAAARPSGGRLRQLFDWPGTFDPTPWLSIGAAIDFGASVPGGWAGIMERNRSLALDARAHISSELGVDVRVPESMVGSMASIPLPEPTGRTGDPVNPAAALRRRLRDDFGIVVPIVEWPGDGARLIRISAALYNRFEDYVRLADALRELLAE